MKKNRIRLSESQLHRVIKESVKQVLSELDWKTYANAASKRYNQGKYDNAEELGKAARDAFNRDYGYDKHYRDYDYDKENDGGDKYEMTSFYDERQPDRYISHYGGRFGDEFRGDEPIFDTEEYPNQKANRLYGSPIRTRHYAADNLSDYDGKHYTDIETNEFNKEGNYITTKKLTPKGGMYYNFGKKDPSSNNGKKARERGNNDISQYVNGKSQYVKGKGWQ